MFSIQKANKEQATILFDRNITDLMKFISCIMVAMSHYSGYVLENALSSSVVFKIIAAGGGYLGVAIFFFLSGYGLMRSDMRHHLGFLDFVKKRLIRTYFPAVLVSFIWLALAVIFDRDLLWHKHYITGIFWKFNDGIMWFVRVILVMYVFFYMYRTTPPISDLKRSLILLLLTVMAYSVIRVTGIGYSLSVPLFFLGVFVADFQKTARKICTSFLWISLMLMCAILTVWMCKHDNYLMHGWINYFCIGVMIVVFANFNMRLSYIPKWLAGCSYDVYLTHYKVHLLILHFCAIDALWMFMCGTSVATAMFYKLRKLLGL